jgi:hypothetical protein
VGAFPEELEHIRDVGTMVETFGSLVWGHISARFAVLPLSGSVDCLAPAAGNRWPQWEVTQTEPYFAVLQAAIDDENEAASAARRSVAEAPVMFAAVVHGCVVLGSMAQSPLFRRLVSRFVSGLYPDVGRAFWNTVRMFGGLERVAGSDQCSGFTVTSYSYRCPLDSAREDSAWGSHRQWAPMTLHQAYADLAERQAWARTVDFRLGWDDPGASCREVSGSISRESVIVARSGVPVVWQHLVVPSAEVALTERQFFQDRARGRSYERPARPFAVRYGSPVFVDPEANHALTQALRDMPDSSLSVYHGNPYLHASLVDHLDGSSFTIWVVDANEITIVPGARASTSSVERLVGHIVDQFREGEVGEAD